ncbi:hypothetical protein LR48_Vigan86s000100 [Vigna angularis]|uniref:Uncharacterized protein n=1 Tax=Phaseolus angularis TaxID=3914 RepID=A0A0L9T3X5_PHAAN|nr:hypothetical protein LR48_Vigan86s000100 [Vigna angularis]
MESEKTSKSAKEEKSQVPLNASLPLSGTNEHPLAPLRGESVAEGKNSTHAHTPERLAGCVKLYFSSAPALLPFTSGYEAAPLGPCFCPSYWTLPHRWRLEHTLIPTCALLDAAIWTPPPQDRDSVSSPSESSNLELSFPAQSNQRAAVFFFRACWTFFFMLLDVHPSPSWMILLGRDHVLLIQACMDACCCCLSQQSHHAGRSLFQAPLPPKPAGCSCAQGLPLF